MWVTVWVKVLTHTLIHNKLRQKVRKTARFPKKTGCFGAGGVIRTHDLLITKSGRGPENADFKRFRGLSARNQMVSGRLVSAVSIRSFPRVGHGVGQGGFRGFTKTVKICTGVTKEYGCRFWQPYSCSIAVYLTIQRYRKVTTSARVQRGVGALCITLPAYSPE